MHIIIIGLYFPIFLIHKSSEKHALSILIHFGCIVSVFCIFLFLIFGDEFLNGLKNYFESLAYRAIGLIVYLVIARSLAVAKIRATAAWVSFGQKWKTIFCR